MHVNVQASAMELLAACVSQQQPPPPRLAIGATAAAESLHDLQQEDKHTISSLSSTARGGATRSACAGASASAAASTPVDAWASSMVSDESASVQLCWDIRLDVVALRVQEAFRLAVKTEMPEVYSRSVDPVNYACMLVAPTQGPKLAA